MKQSQGAFIMEKNRSLWLIGICVAIIIIIVAGAGAMTRMGSSKTKGSAESSVIQENSDASLAVTGADQDSSMSERHMDHSVHGSQASGAGDQLDRYLTEQDSIMMNMMEEMIIREKTGSASIDFLKGMIPHHEAAIKMSESYLNYSKESSGLQAMAQDIITVQKKELDLMNGLIEKYREEGKKDQGREDAYLEKFSGMFSRDSLSHHINPTGADTIDQAFAESMIMHHQMAVDMAKDILDYTDEEEIRQLAREIIDVQEKEIEQFSLSLESR